MSSVTVYHLESWNVVPWETETGAQICKSHEHVDSVYHEPTISVAFVTTVAYSAKPWSAVLNSGSLSISITNTAELIKFDTAGEFLYFGEVQSVQFDTSFLWFSAIHDSAESPGPIVGWTANSASWSKLSQISIRSPEHRVYCARFWKCTKNQSELSSNKKKIEYMKNILTRVLCTIQKGDTQ